MKRLPVFVGLAAMMLGVTAKADPATQPAASEPQCDVYVVPFTGISGDNSLDWAGKAVAQNLLTDLARGKMHPLAADKAPANTTDAQTAAKAAGAKYLITGTYQMADQLIRFNGQIIDPLTGNVLGGLTATGAMRDLFNLEDALSSQAMQQLGALPAIANNKPAAPVPAALQPAVVVQVVQPPAVAAPGQASGYQGSALQDYVDSNRTPSTDYAQQARDAANRDLYNPYDYTYGSYGTYLPGYSFGFLYSFPSGGYRPYGGHHDHDGR